MEDHHILGCGNVVDEEGHSSSRASELVSDFVRVKSKAHLSTKGWACAQDMKDVSVGNEASLAMLETNGVDGGETVGLGHGLEDLLDLGPIWDDRTCWQNLDFPGVAGFG